MGMINLLRGPYLVLITGREVAGTIGLSTIYRVTETRVVKVAADSRVVSGTDAFDESTYLRLLHKALSVDSFFFSYDFDLTSSLERQQQKRSDTPVCLASSAMYKTANDEFFFNKYLSEPLIKAVVDSSNAGVFVLPVIHGFFDCKHVIIKGTSFNYVLVTRRGRKRQGTRYFSRGADEDGNVSNFAETEQIVDFAASNAASVNRELEGLQMSYVQLRGSIPIVWAQVINMRYVPTLRVDIDASRDRFNKHMNRIVSTYNEVVAVNLVNKVKYEKPMGDAFAQLSREFNSPHYHYTHFDFHKECSKMRWDRISILMDELAEYNTRFGYFKVKRNTKDHSMGGEVLHLQTGVVRSNCMDCLDRTNVVQSELARVILTRQLRETGVFLSTDVISNFPEMMSMMNNLWADNADAVSCAYSGTGALKTDFTRTGQRTKLGALQDGRNSVERYFRGNFFDGDRQDATDLLLGKFKPKSGMHPFVDNLSLESKALVGTVYISIFMLIYAFFFPRGGHWFCTSNFLFVTSWVMVLALVFWTVKDKHTGELLNWPRLSAYPFRPVVLRANSAISLPLVDRLFSSAATKASLRNDDIKKAWPTDKKQA
ncbi:Phosphoinositide phosphatase sac1 [Coemansia interrupta]|uniref:Phosphoinositide phosphatase sac1 n=1 Tax=Coemansia interrupta TaxID=1126814 RepID=A0A9W8HB67_9FUNG|nr:Phosphoinositide phosphatase sac1 [Coemansia interrupta]